MIDIIVKYDKKLLNNINNIIFMFIYSIHLFIYIILGIYKS